SQIEIEATAERAVRVGFPLDAAATPSEAWFENYRSRPRGSRLALRSARQMMALQQGRLELTVAAGAAQLVATFAPAAGARPAAADAAVPAPGSAARTPGTHILLVEDSHEVRTMYREALVALGYTVTEVANAEEALRSVQGAVPDVALIDIHL